MVTHMEHETMMQYWDLMGVERVDEDERKLRDMHQTPQVKTLRRWANEAMTRHRAWVAKNHPELLEEAQVVPEA